MASIKQWSPESWQSSAASQGPAIVQLFDKLGLRQSLDAIVHAYTADSAVNLKLMKAALGCSQMTTDINYVWTSSGKMALLMDDSKIMSMEEAGFDDVDFVTYDTQLRAWVADLEMMHTQTMAHLSENFEWAMTDNQEQAATDVYEQMKEYDVSNICEKGLWANGIALAPIPKFFVVTKWIKQHYAKFFDMANKMIFQGP
jgi:hypothetical protein